MFGMRDEFDYLECGRCGTLQIVTVPDLAKYYPGDYYSLETDLSDWPKLRRRIAARLMADYLLTGRGFWGRYLARHRTAIADLFPWFLRDPILSLRSSSRILDVGCGTGELLQRLSLFGFTDLTGADAFIEKELNYRTGVRILKCSLDELESAYDLIMLHHSFEHLPDPHAAMAELARILAPNGTCLIRIPLVNLAWERYGINWVQMDPPRHLFLYTERSFAQLAERNGFKVEKVVYDSEGFQFFGSEQYLQDIPLNDPRAYHGIISESIFSDTQLAEWEKEAIELNENGRGDQACFYLKKA